MPDDLTQEEVNAISGTRSDKYWCDCCETEGVEVTATRVPKHTNSVEMSIRWYCDLCRGTMASNFHRHGRPEGHVLAGMAYMVNTLLKALKEKR